MARHTGPDNVFLPFCDTDEEDLVAEVKGRRLFDLDRQRLTHLDGMLAILHGPTLDDGVCMEIGYAAALRVPIIVLTTDFQTYGPSKNGPPLAFPDPLVETVADQVVRAHRLGAPTEGSDRFTVFAKRNATTIRAGIDQAVTALLERAAHPASQTQVGGGGGTLFIEPTPYGPPSTDWTELVREHKANATGQQRHARRLTSPDPLAAAAQDWAAATGSDTVIADLSGPETPPGAALLIGAAAATGRRVLAYCPGPAWTFAHGREPNWRNLMIQYAVTGKLATACPRAAVASPASAR
ncbi:nucleoside 2-deoxyribosyltransferase [Actinoplanes sp. NPDC051343]|uniref:nucleoside 2-deoxyribosyltransferase n=1 Tax=Actinoplanes sp. NPDC051343 TaxID=3363906 RepID=UPI0037903ECC